MLSEARIIELGFLQATADETEINSATTPAALAIVDNLRDSFARLGPTQVGGHFNFEYNTANRPLPDPCEVPRRMGEFLLSHLPPLT